MARMRNQEPDGEEYKATQSEVHLRSAKRLLHVCQVSTFPIYTYTGGQGGCGGPDSR